MVLVYTSQIGLAYTAFRLESLLKLTGHSSMNSCIRTETWNIDIDLNHSDCNVVKTHYGSVEYHFSFLSGAFNATSLHECNRPFQQDRKIKYCERYRGHWVQVGYDDFIHRFYSFLILAFWWKRHCRRLRLICIPFYQSLSLISLIIVVHDLSDTSVICTAFLARNAYLKLRTCSAVASKADSLSTSLGSPSLGIKKKRYPFAGQLFSQSG